MDVVLLERSKTVLPDGGIVEIVLWRAPEPVAGSVHLYKYRLFYGRNGRRIAGFDNERGKGDHCHLDGTEHPYAIHVHCRLAEGFSGRDREKEALNETRAHSNTQRR